MYLGAIPAQHDCRRYRHRQEDPEPCQQSLHPRRTFVRGQVITGAGTDDRVRGLVYICALGPDEGETAQEQLGKFPTTPVFKQIEVADGRVWMKPRASRTSVAIFPKRSRKSSGRRTIRRRRTCSTPPWVPRHGRRSRVGSSSAKTTGPCLRTSSGLCQNAWEQPRSSWTRVTARCSRNRPLSSTSS